MAKPAKTMTTGSNKPAPGTAKKVGKEELTPVDLRAKVKGLATEKHPHAESGEEIECHPLMMEHLAKKGFVIYDKVEPDEETE